MIGVVADQKGLRNVLAGVDDEALLLRLPQEFRRALRLRGDLKVENADDVLFREHHVVADVQIHSPLLYTTAPPAIWKTLPLRSVPSRSSSQQVMNTCPPEMRFNTYSCRFGSSSESTSSSSSSGVRDVISR